MGVEDLGGLADFATEASAVASNIIENGKEFLSDGFNQLQEQVSTFAGDSSWFDSNFIGDIVPADVTTLTKSFNFDSLSSFTSEFPSLSSITSNFPSIDSLTSGLPSLSSSFPSLSKILPNPSSIANSLVNQVQNTAISLATNTVKQAVASVVPPSLQPYTNQIINTTARSISGAGRVSSTIPGTPGFVGPPAPSTAFSRVDPTQLEGFGIQASVDPTTLEGFGIQASVDPTTLEGYGVNEVGSTREPTTNAAPVDTNQSGEGFGNVFSDGFGGFVNGDGQPVDANGSLIPTGDNITRSTVSVDTNQSGEGFGNVFSDGFGGFVNGDGQPVDANGSLIPTGDNITRSATPADPQSLTQLLTRATDSVVRSFTPGTVNDPSLARQPIDSAALAILASLAPGESALINGRFISAGSPEALALADAAARTQGLLRQAQNQQTARIQSNNNAATGDWRVRLQLANASDYLYNAPDCGPLLWPLRDTNGVIFPYTPTIDTSYKANYSTYDLTHSNHRGYFYQNSYIDGINIKATFTAQDTVEANYVLACIHFFRSVTKMFYGQDAQRGTPPPLVFLSGLGDFQFNRHPCLVSQFNYNLPADVNYIRAQSTLSNGDNLLAARRRQTTLGNPIASTVQRLASLGQKIFPGAVTAPFAPQGSLAAGNPTYVPTKMEISLVLLPVQTRSQVSQQFSLRGFANGNLLKGGFW